MNVMLKTYGAKELENNSVKRVVEMGLLSNEPQQSINLNGDELGTLINFLAKG